uniref:Calicivirus coat protein domain-containing protein n=1 Tax=Picornavirales sp. TaxID=1955153 RepID=A0A6M3YNU4_9VIRU|nr:MAG: hypothetical protein 2 [Picornavirales sp.]
MSHIPQPTSGDSNLETQFHSTQLQANGPTIAPIETPTPNTREVQAAAGEEVTIPDYFYKQWRRVATLEWTTNDPIGKVLWTANVSPLELDPALAYQMALFHAWGGDFEVSVRAVATGFHAGQMAIVSVPPGIELEDINNPLDYTLFPYEVMDVKKLEANAFTIRDRRNTKYHYMKRDNSPPGVGDIGGRVGLFVDTPLTTSATGVQKIALAVWARCASNFRVAYVRNPLMHQPTQVSYVPEPIIAALNASLNSLLANGPTYAKELSIQPSDIKVYKKWYSNCVRMNGKVFQPLKEPVYWHKRDISIISGKMDSSGRFDVNNTSQNSYPLESGSTECTFQVAGTSECETLALSRSAFSGSLYFLVFQQPSKLVGKQGTLFVRTGSTNFNGGVFPEQNITIIKEGEGLVTFSNGAANCVQTENIALLFVSFAFPDNLPQNKCYSIVLKSKLTGLPIANMKLHRGGYMTAQSLPKVTTKFLLFDCTFEQNGIMGVLDSFPNPLTTNANMAAHLFLAKQAARNSKRIQKAEEFSVAADQVELSKWQPSHLFSEDSPLEEDSPER